MKHHISKFVEITDDEYDEISRYFELMGVKKKQVLHEVNTICRHNYFVVKGCFPLGSCPTNQPLALW